MEAQIMELPDNANAQMTHYALKVSEEYAFYFSDWDKSSSLGILLCSRGQEIL